jgi:putative nucleotidyltransferase-like protein
LGSETPPGSDRPTKSARDLSAPATRAILALWAREGRWAEISIAGVSMSPLIPDASRLTVRFGRQGLTPGDVVLYATDSRIIAHRVLRLGRRGRRWGFLKVKGDPVRSGEAAWVPVEDVVGRVVAVRRPDGVSILLNTAACRLANRLAAGISGAAAWTEGKARGVLGASRRLTATPALLSLLGPLYRFGSRSRKREAGLLLSSEERFMLVAARVRMSAEDDRRLRQALGNPVTWGRLPAAAAPLGLAPILYRNLSRAEIRHHVPAAVLSALGRNAHASACQMAIQIEALDEMLEALGGEGIEPILLKGAALALTVYEQPALRPMQDLDLLVEEKQVDAAAAVLVRLGFRAIAATRTAAFYAAHHHTVPMIGKGGRVIVEIHRGLVPPEEGLRIDPARFFERAIRVEARGRTYRILSREDQVVHACLHLSYCDRFVGRLRDLIDVHALVETGAKAPDWGVILDTSPRTDVCRSLFSSLDLARRLLGTPVPPEVLNELARGAGWDPVAERLLRVFARSSLFMGSFSEGLLPGPSARFLCGTLIKRARWSTRLKDLAQILGAA